ncbi:hypothetical protein K437DRAFT_258231 [Tilletiaria anomala UBC 951]|uniref:Uncharacterized protein n=1 Tax=Tilletiaria anomala (strain ATCC 24038 / CBS 436.72 / UBC 951) TaxID=1037660 RepID=A0A066VIF4_TILAU|nr:uncharacterized protein K437DRAFT_258231 [Tilletiaria anomala UBC 951]KDN41522.1 hypothetical protein K437DRAFT_258231 [Tilletiaria anomala UBC 951]
MAVRCFARRALTPARKPVQRAAGRVPDVINFTSPSPPVRSFSAASAWGKQKAPEAEGTDEVQPWWESSSGFFSASRFDPRQPTGGNFHHSHDLAASTSTVGADASSVPSTTYGPKIAALLQAIYAAGPQKPPADKVWDLYLALSEGGDAAPAAPATGSSTLPLTGDQSASENFNTSLFVHLAGVHHQQVLRAIAPEESANGPQGSQVELQTFIDRAWYIFGQMRQHSISSSIGSFFAKSFDSPESTRFAKAGQLPATSDYNFLLGKAASQGRLNVLLAIWQDMQSRTSLSARGQEAQLRTPAAQPDRWTFELLMQGLFRHTKAQLARIYQQDSGPRAPNGDSRSPWPKNRPTLQSVKNKAVEAALLTSQGRQGSSDVAIKARRASLLAAERCFSLIHSMQAQSIDATTLTLDMAARMLRLAGDMPAFKRLLKDFFALDLSNPDGATRLVTTARPPNVHTLNTILMALGEFGTVPQMIVAYETISRPLLASTTDSTGLPAAASWGQEDDGILGDDGTVAAVTAIADAGGQASGRLFQLDWSALSRKDASAPEASTLQFSPLQSSSPVTPYASPRQIHPITKTFSTMIRHALTPMDIERVAMFNIGSGERSSHKHALRAAAEEQRRRSAGDYLLLVKSLLREVIDLVRDATNRIERHVADCTTAAPATTSSLNPEVLAQHLLPATEMLAPVFSFASRTQSRGILSWLENFAQTALHTVREQADVLQAARHSLLSNASTSASTPGATATSAFLAGIEVQLSHLQRTEDDLVLMIDKRIRPRLISLAAKRRRGMLRRAERRLATEAEQRARAAEEARLAEEEKRQQTIAKEQRKAAARNAAPVEYAAEVHFAPAG